jgi:hypothetical protein
MTVLECVLAAASEIGIGEEVLRYTQGEAGGEKMVSNLVRCFNLVENQLALDYLPLFAEDEFYSETGVIDFSSLTKSPIRIVKVRDAVGQDLKFTLFPAYLKPEVGKVIVRYSYAPKEKTLQDSSDFLLYASVRLFAYGMAAEYFTASGLYEEAAVWNVKYKDAIKAAYQQSPNRKIKTRRWI